MPRISVLQRVYELALALAILALVGGVFHQRHTSYHNITGTQDATHVLFYADASEAGDFLVDAEMAIYRYSSDWVSRIGVAKVETVVQSDRQVKVVLAYDPKAFVWAMGRQGTVQAQLSPNQVSVNLGYASNFRVGDRLNLFSGRAPAAIVRVDRVYEAHLVATVEAVNAGYQSSQLLDMTVSEFTIPTFATSFKGGIYSAIEYCAIAAVFGLWSFAIWKRRNFFFWLQPLAASMPYFLGRVSPQLRNFNLDSVTSRFRYSPEKSLLFRSRINRKLLISLLYLVIVFAFGHALYAFLIGNIAIIKSTLEASPDLRSWESYFSLARYAIWSAAIVGCMFGYGYSILSPLWDHHIRNLDFTITGWVTNAVCYPLLGFVLVSLTPALSGNEPTFTGGPWPVFVFSVELLLNILYTASIWNLGRKFGVMTDKGLVDRGFYSVVRHPGYTLEVGMFLCLCLHGLSSPINWLAAVLTFVVPYYLRSERDDHFMTVSNPDYPAYKLSVPYKYIPGLL